MDTSGETTGAPIVVGVDGSTSSSRALRWAAQVAASRGVLLRIVTAWSVPVGSWPVGPASAYDDPAVLLAEATALVTDSMTAVRDELGARAPEIEVLAVEGRPAAELLQIAADASLLVLGSRGRGGFASLLLGSVSHACAHHSLIPVAVVSDDSPLEGAGDVVVGVDRSDGSKLALRWAVAEASRRGSRLIAVHGWQIPVGVPSQGMSPPPVVDAELIADTDQMLTALVDEALDGIEAPPDVEKRAVPLGGSQALLREAKGAEVLVVGSRGRGGFAGLLLGSTSQQCLHHSPCTIVIVPGHGPGVNV